MSSAKAEFSTGWGVVVSSAAGFGLGMSGLPFYTTGVFVEPLSKAFGWSVASIQGGLTIMLLANMASLPAAAWLSQRFGPRRVALASVAAFGLSFMLLATTDRSLPGFYLRWILLSVAGAGTLPVVWARTISAWFERARGAALGLAMIGTGITGLIAPVLANLLIERLGWRGAYVALGALPLLVALPLVWVLFRHPVEPAAPAAPAAPAGERPPAQAGPPITADWRFWLIGCAFLLIGSAVAGVVPNLVKLLRMNGFSPSHAAEVASLVGLFVILGRVSCGALLDRFWASGVTAVFFILAGASCLLLRGGRLDPIAVSVAAAAVGLAVGAEFDAMPYLASRYFGVERVGVALGLLSVFFYFGAATGPWGFGRMVELCGGYDIPLIVAAGFFTAGGAALLLLGRYPSEHAPGDGG
jgi:MFS family permease